MGKGAGLACKNVRVGEDSKVLACVRVACYVLRTACAGRII